MYYLLQFALFLLYGLLLFVDSGAFLYAISGVIFGLVHFLIYKKHIQKNKEIKKSVVYFPATIMVVCILSLLINCKYKQLPYYYNKSIEFYVLGIMQLFFSMITYIIGVVLLHKKTKVTFINDKNYIKKVIFFIVLLLLIIWVSEIIKNEVYTIKYGEQFENIPALTENVGPCEYFKVIDYRGDAARLYYITSYEPNPTGNVVILEYYDGSWHYVGQHTVWSTMGSADEAIWPYWWHYFTR